MTSIDGHLHSPLISRVDVRLSPFCLLHSTSIIIFYSTYSAMSMAHSHVLRESWKGLRTSKVWNNYLACHWGCAWFEYFMWWRWSIARLYDFYTVFGTNILIQCEFLFVACFFAENPYQTESKRDKNWWRFFGIYVIFGNKINARRCPRGPRGRGAFPRGMGAPWPLWPPGKAVGALLSQQES